MRYLLFGLFGLLPIIAVLIPAWNGWRALQRDRAVRRQHWARFTQLMQEAKKQEDKQDAIAKRGVLNDKDAT